MIELRTGTPGAGKTLIAIADIKARAEKEQRPVFYSGIAELQLPWTEIEAEKWYECPPNSIVVIDEAQRIFRPRSFGGQVPPHVSELETHRHKGIDLVIITQHPMLLDTNVRRLVGRHFHVVRTFGMKRATLHEWAECKESCDKARSDSVRHERAYPTEVFKLYKSAEVHTHKARIPARVWFLFIGPLLVAGLVYAIVQWWVGASKPKVPAQAATSVPGRPAGSFPLPPAPGSPAAIRASNDEWLAARMPRLQGLPHTAPVYDSITQPTEVPYPAACVASAARCNCYTQQATQLDMSEDLCRDIAAKGFFVPWQRNRPLADQADHAGGQRHPNGMRPEAATGGPAAGPAGGYAVNHDRGATGLHSSPRAIRG